MKKSHFTNKTIYWIVIVLISGLMLWNFYATVITGQLIGLLPITIQGALLWLIFDNHQYAKIAIKVWAIIFFCIASGLQFIGRLLQDFVEGFVNIDKMHYLKTGVTLLIGVFIIMAINKSVKIIEIESELSDDKVE
ncbi:hypothetical protein [Parapedobacter lycopersici]|uniref:hypothetical protein n=1 Tax=Parapedobacter lycopersici TaxID=1864939 RepID=UPI00214D6070|nr:hypothetical protein [Parapedobacter lycopersici]